MAVADHRRLNLTRTAEAGHLPASPQVCPVDLARQLADALRRMREDAGLTHAEMAKRLGISRPTYTRLENADQNTTLKTLG